MSREDLLENGRATHFSTRLENSMDREAWWGYTPKGHKESDTAERLTHTGRVPRTKKYR